MEDESEEQKPGTFRRERGDAAMATPRYTPASSAAAARSVVPSVLPALKPQKRTYITRARDLAARLFRAGTPHTKNPTPHARTSPLNIVPFAPSHWLYTQGSCTMLLHFVAGVFSCCVADSGAAPGAATCAGSAIRGNTLGSVLGKVGFQIVYCCDGSSQPLNEASEQLQRRDHDKCAHSLQMFCPTGVAFLCTAILLLLTLVDTRGLRLEKICALFCRKAGGFKATSRRTSTVRRWLIPLLLLAYLNCEGASSVPSYYHRGNTPFHHGYFPQQHACLHKPSTALSTAPTFPGAKTPVSIITPAAASQASHAQVVRHTRGQQRTHSSRAGVLPHIQPRRPLRASTLLQQQQEYRVHYGGGQQQRAQGGCEGQSGANPASGYIYPYQRPGRATSVPPSSHHHAVHVRHSSSAPFRTEFPAIYDKHNVPLAGPLKYTSPAFPVSAYPTAYTHASYHGTALAPGCVDCEGRRVQNGDMRRPHHTYPYITVPVPPFPAVWQHGSGSHFMECYSGDPRHISPRIHLSGRMLHRPTPAAPRKPDPASPPQLARPISRTSRTNSSPRATSRPSARTGRSHSLTGAHSARADTVVPGRAVSSPHPPARRGSTDFPRRGKAVLQSHSSAAPRTSTHYLAVSTPGMALPSPHHLPSMIPSVKVYPRLSGDLRVPDYNIGRASALENLGGVARSRSSQKPSLSIPRDSGAFIKRFGASAVPTGRAAAEPVVESEERRSPHAGERKTTADLAPAAEEERRQREEERQKDNRGRRPSVHLDRARVHYEPEVHAEPWVEEEEQEELEPDEEPEEEFEEEEEEDLEEPEYQEEEEEVEEEDDEEEKNQLQTREKVRRESKDLSPVVHQPVKITDWDYCQQGEDWKIGRAGCASQERQSPINFDEAQHPLSADEADALQQLWKDQERRRTCNEATLRFSTRRGRGTQDRFPTRYSSSSRARRQLIFPKNLMVDAKDDDTKALQVRLGTAINRYVVKLVPSKKAEFMPEKHQSSNSGNSRKQRHLISSFGFIRTGGKVYDAINFHFHAPAEHTFSMRRRALELHIVCEHTATDLVVIGITFEGVDDDVAATGVRTDKIQQSHSVIASSAPRAVSRVARSSDGAVAATGAGIEKKKADRRHGAAATRRTKRTKRRAIAPARSEEDTPGLRAEPSSLKKEAHVTEKDEHAGEGLQVQKGDKVAAIPATSEEANAADKGHRRGEEATRAQQLISKGAHDFLAAVTEAIRLTLDAEGKKGLAGEYEMGSVRERSRQRVAEVNEEGHGAAAPRRRLVHEDEEEGEPFHSTRRKGRPWFFPHHIQDYPKDTSGLWGPWASFDGSSTTVTSEESVMPRQQGFFPLMRTLSSGYAPADAQQVRQVQKGSGVRDVKEDGERNSGRRRDGGRDSTTVPFAEDGMQDDIATVGEAEQPKESRKRTRIHRRRRTIIEAEKDELFFPTVNLQALLAGESRLFYRYNGSLTTPPCSETVLWYVLKEPLYVEKSLLKAVQNVLQPAGNELQGTYRVLQNAEGRDNNRENVYVVKQAV